MKKQSLSLNSNYAMFLFILMCAVLGITGCSSTPKNQLVSLPEIQQLDEIHKPILLRTSEEDFRPAWTKKTVSEAQGKVYFAGGFMNGSDYSVTIRCANAEALKASIQGISQYIRAEFSSYAQGSNTDIGGIERYVEDGIATFTKNLHVQGFRQRELYWEEMLSPGAIQSTYNVWVMLEMNKADYLRAKADVLRNLRDKFAEAGQTEAKEKAEKLLEELKDEVRRET
jgi:hypothetical protein